MRIPYILVFSLFLSASGFADTLLVPDDHADIQGAIDAAGAGDTVLVAAGSYVENIDFKGKAITVTSEVGPLGTIIDGNQNWSVAIFVNGEGPGSVLEGFTLYNGQGSGSPNYVGGGITCKGTSPTIQGNIIRANYAGIGTGYGNGGGIYLDGASPVIRNNTITENLANYEAGAIYCRSGSHPVIEDNMISYNTANITCGGVYCAYSSSPTIRGNRFHANACYDICMGWGGGVFCYDKSSPLIENNSFTDNVVFKHGGAVCCQLDSNPIIRNNYMSGNWANRRAGGIMIEGASPEVTDNVIVGNSAIEHGGGVGIVDSSSKIVNNIIANNTCSGLYGGYGGGIDCEYASCVITNNTLYGNTALEEGGGIRCYASDVTFTNNILWDNDAPKGREVLLGNTSIFHISYCDMMGGQGAAHVEPGCTLNWGAGVFNADPLFVDAAGNDFHLYYTSPCRNAGDDGAPELAAEDFEGDLRSAHGAVDIGADEFYTHLYYTGDAVPAGTVHIHMVGLPNTTPVGLFVGSGLLDPGLNSVFGTWYLQFPVTLIGPLAPIPGDGVEVLTGTLPGVPDFETIPLQALIGDALSNLCVIEIQ
jgi:parallel beta-helix repeat protein